MEAFLQVLAKCASDPTNIPPRIRGRVMHHFADICPSRLVCRQQHESEFCLHVGLYPDSCTATAAAVAFWLCPPEDGVPKTLPELRKDETYLELLASDVQIAKFLQPVFGDSCAWLLVFSTTAHKFTFLCVGHEAALIQSNQDDTRGGHRFTLSEWLATPPKRWRPSELSFFIRHLAEATNGNTSHEAFCDEHFDGAKFKRGEKSSYWVVKMPVTLIG